MLQYVPSWAFPRIGKVLLFVQLSLKAGLNKEQYDNGNQFLRYDRKVADTT